MKLLSAREDKNEDASHQSTCQSRSSGLKHGQPSEAQLEVQKCVAEAQLAAKGQKLVHDELKIPLDNMKRIKAAGQHV